MTTGPCHRLRLSWLRRDRVEGKMQNSSFIFPPHGPASENPVEMFPSSNGKHQKVWGNQAAHSSASTDLPPAFSRIPLLELPHSVPSRVRVRISSMRCAPQFLVLSLPRLMTRKPGSITCPSEGTVAFQGAGSSRRQQARRSTESAARRRAEVVPLSQDHLLCAVAKVFRVRDA